MLCEYIATRVVFGEMVANIVAKIIFMQPFVAVGSDICFPNLMVILNQCAVFIDSDGAIVVCDLVNMETDDQQTNKPRGVLT